MNNYPVKYALIPFYKNDLSGYMAVKCYVLDIINEKEDDEFKTYYKISYPVDNDSFNYEVGITYELFNCYELANDMKMKKNRDLLNEKVNNCLVQDRKSMYINFRKNLEDLEIFENLLSNYSKDLKVTKGKVKTRSL